MRYILVSLYVALTLAGNEIKWTSAQTALQSDNCRTPSNVIGSCMVIKQCKRLIAILEKGSVTDAERNYLRSSQCGYLGGNILVCCPLETTIERHLKSPLPDIPNCAKSRSTNGRLGYDTDIDDYPWLARIQYTTTDGSKDFHCTGNLINDRYVLVAAHCVMRLPNGWQLTAVRLGEYDTRTDPDCIDFNGSERECAEPHVDVLVNSIIVHPEYRSTSRSQHHNIALLRLSQPVKMSAFIQPVCLPQQSNIRDDQFDSQYLHIVGWGSTEPGQKSVVKQAAPLKVWTQSECQEVYNRHNISLIDGQICAGGEQDRGGCRGDSGSPLVYTNRAGQPYYILAGILSFGTTICGTEGWPDVFTRITAYVDWIRSNVDPNT